MKDYQLFTTEEFIADGDFIRWVFDKDPKDDIFWQQWLGRYPDKHATVTEARRVLESIAIGQKIVSKGEINLEIEKVLHAIGNTGEENSLRAKEQPVLLLPVHLAPVRKMLPFLRKGSVAAIFIIFAGITSYFLYRHNKTSSPKEFNYSSLTTSLHLAEKVNSSDKPETIQFADGSLIRIAPHSRISFQAGFDSATQRDIYLLGEAFFQVAKNPRHPFRVFAGGVVTKVLGTSFCVRSFDKDTTIQVTVKTGKVSVYDDANPMLSGNSGGIILTPNQRLVYEKTAQKFHKVLLEHPAIVDSVITDHNMAYVDTPLEQVFDQLSKVYGIILVYDNELLKKCTVTADLKGETFYHKLDLICRAVGAQYEVIDGQVVILSNGCQ
ncbi:FecR family protein [Flavitalea flava]